MAISEKCKGCEKSCVDGYLGIKIKGGYEMANWCQDFLDYKREIKIKNKLGKCGIIWTSELPSWDKVEYKTKTFKNQTEKCKKFIKESLKRKLFLYGKAGTGKTMIMLLLYIEKLNESFFIHSGYLRKIVIDSNVYNEDRDHAVGILKKMQNAKYVFIDDLGTETQNDLYEAYLEQFLNCYGGKLIFSSNLFIKKIPVKGNVTMMNYGIRLQDRLIDRMQLIHLNEKSYREIRAGL